MTLTATLVAGTARVEVNAAIGGAVASFTFGGVDVLRPTPGGLRDVRLHACYPLVPYSNRIADAQLEFDSRAYALARNFGDHPHAIHGLGWQRPWMILAHDANSTRLALDHDAKGDAARGWPWPLHASQAFSLRTVGEGEGAVLAIKLTIANPGPSAFPFGLGWHPFFVRSPATKVGFRARGVWHTDATRLPTLHAAITQEWRFDSPRQPGNATIDNVFTGWDGEAALVDAQRRLRVTVRADRALRFLVVYAPQAREFLALEPVTQMTDAFNRAARGEHDTGTRVLAPGSAFSCTMEIEVHSLP